MTLKSVLHSRSGWDLAVSNLRDLISANGPDARADAARYASVYQRRRAVMVFDVVASRQRHYDTRVKKLTIEFESHSASVSLSSLASTESSPVSGLRRGEWETMRNVAGGLIEFGSQIGQSDDDEICLQWSTSTEDVRFAHRIDPFVGAVSGIGPALFAYLRMRSGASAIKPDLRVRKAIRTLGIEPPNGEIALLLICEELAKEVDIDRLVFDQLLWRLGLNLRN